MKFRTNLAYSKTNVQRQNQHIDQHIINKKIHIGRIYHNRVRLRLKFYIFSIITATIFLSMFILSLVKCTEITASLNKTKRELQLQKSYNTLLKTKLEQTTNLQKIEKYAKENLHMAPLNNNQINYIKASTGNRIERPTENSNINIHTNSRGFKRICNKIKEIFENFKKSKQ